MREIGSEFWIDKKSIVANKATVDVIRILDGILNIGNDQHLLFSGRTAIDYVLEDISKPIGTVYMPSYCCDSMLQPFIDRGIKIELYSVILDDTGIKYSLDYKKDIDIFFATSYFGYSSSVMDSAIETFKGRDVIIIEDITHRLLNEQNYCIKADYLIASLRKWFPLPSGGLAVKMDGDFKEVKTTGPPARLISNKIEAMNQKAEYIAYGHGKGEYEKELKNSFLALFCEFNTGIIKTYKNARIDSVSKSLLSAIDVAAIKKQRRQNAQYLHRELKETRYIRFLFKKADFQRDCPLFVPIMVESSARESLKKYLIANDIFCPVHWPMPNRLSLTTQTEKLYKQQLSLICDQRYDHKDMERITEVMEEFVKAYE